jgi:hypothetical protein
MAQVPEYIPGLAGIPAARSSICLIDGSVGKLQYRGYPIEVLAERGSYEEVAYLLLFGRLPSTAQLDEFRHQLIEERGLKFRIIDLLKTLPESGEPMDALTAAVAAMGMFYKGDHISDPEFLRLSVIRLVAKLPTIVAAWHRIRRGDDPIKPSTELSHAANFLYMLEGEVPTRLAERVFDVALTLHAEHSMNASTFTARVTGSTLTDPYAVVRRSPTLTPSSLKPSAALPARFMVAPTSRCSLLWVASRIAHPMRCAAGRRIALHAKKRSWASAIVSTRSKTRARRSSKSWPPSYSRSSAARLTTTWPSSSSVR